MAQHPPLVSLRSLAPPYAGTKGASNLKPPLYSPFDIKGEGEIPLRLRKGAGGMPYVIPAEAGI